MLPKRVEALVRGLGMHAVKVALLGAIARRDHATGPELAAEIGVSSQMVSHHLRSLEASNLVIADRSRRSRGGPAVTWTVNRTALRAELTAMQELFFPDDDK